MKKLSMLALLAIVTCGNAMYAMDMAKYIAERSKNRPEVYTVLDAVTKYRPNYTFDWQPVFAILDRMDPVINVNEYKLPMGTTLLFEAVMQHNFSAAKTLLTKYHADPNLSAPLHMAIHNHDKAIANLLRSYGATETE